MPIIPRSYCWLDTIKDITILEGQSPGGPSRQSAHRLILRGAGVEVARSCRYKKENARNHKGKLETLCICHPTKQ